MHTRPIEADTAPERRTDLDTTVANQTAEQAPRPLAQYSVACPGALVSGWDTSPLVVLAKARITKALAPSGAFYGFRLTI
jgi:hypothetical protein